MFRAHVLIVRRSKLHCTASGIITLKQVSGLKLLKYNSINISTYGTLKTMTLARHMHYMYLTADMNMATLTTLWLFSSRSTHRPFCFHMNKCTSSRSTIIMNSSPNNFWTSINLYLTSFIQILHVITHLAPNPQSHAFQPVLSQPVHETTTYRVSTF